MQRAEQVEDHSVKRGIVEREVIRGRGRAADMRNQVDQIGKLLHDLLTAYRKGDDLFPARCRFAV